MPLLAVRRPQAMASRAVSVFLCCFLFFFTFPYASSSSIGAESVVRESFPMDGDVAWVVQISDLHLSAYHPDRASDLVRLLAPALRVIRPALLLITGDITDAKNKRRTATRQDLSEWIQYKNSMEAVVNHSGLDKRIIFDIRGNHDKYGVPHVGHPLDFFSVHSVSAQLGRLSTIQSISLVGNDRRYVFIGIDDTISIGIRGPSNFFGHPTDGRAAAVESELQYWDIYPNNLVTKVIFGHYPMSFTASTKNGQRYENLFAKYVVSSYICGHLHAKISRQLWRFHSSKSPSDVKVPKMSRSFWEWELGDWKESRLIRILAIDRGVVSFLDIDFLRKFEVEDVFQTTILITYPVDSRMMNVEHNNHSLRNDINALVFSTQKIINVTAKVFDSSRNYKIVEEVPLQLIDIASNKPLFCGRWNAENYWSASATRYILQVSALDSQGKETRSNLRPFSVEGKQAPYRSTLLAYLIFEVEWESLYSVLLWSNICFLLVLLFLPKVLNCHIENYASYQSISLWIQQRKSLFVVYQVLMEGSRNRVAWFSMLIYLIYLLKLPWFWGYATSENGDIASMYLSGWRVPSPDGQEKLGTPDIMLITLPFLYLVVTPMFVLIYSLFAERSAFCSHLQGKSKCQNEPMSSHIESEQLSQLVALVPSNYQNLSPTCKIYRGWKRRFLQLGCLVVALIHCKLCLTLMLAYGFLPVLLSPALSWAPLLLLVGAYMCSTSVDMES
ncbi:putative metallophosphoesterase At3g03305 isoform X2 [Curcuma longa]|uniref:putative metallophosphoesterase At3g03305 isoform X2 n=1 Tax=Curcuma longa TaxID=136217 RepID=UPI003D9EDFAC